MIEFIKSVLIEGGELFYQHEPKIVKTKKGVGNWVTAEDIIIESLILKRIKEDYPNHIIISEEDDVLPKSPNKLEHLWVIDPLDGTTNAVFGFPHFGIAIAYMEKGEVIRSGLYDIPNKIVCWAEKGKGAFILESTYGTKPKKLKVREGLLKDGLVGVGSPYLPKYMKKMTEMMNKVYKKGARIVNTGSAVCDAKFVAEGKWSLFYEIGLEPWDLAAESLIVEEAGGRAADFSGKLDIFKSEEIIWGNKEIVKEFLKLV